MFIDTHLHLSYNYGDDPENFVSESLKNDVGQLIVSACDMEAMLESENLLKEFPDLYFSFGFHPEFSLEVGEKELLFLERKLKSNNRIVGVGEIGLDYHYGKENRKEQILLFEKQLKLAEKYNLPVVIHSRDATQDTYEILKKNDVRGVIHCFSGSLEMALNYIELGFYIGIGGVVTFKNSNLQDVVKKIPLSSIVLETDSPYLAPDPYRGQTNSSKYIPIIAAKIASLKEISINEVMQVTTNNAIKLFDLDK